MNYKNPPNINEVLGEFNAGVFMAQVEEALKQVALGTINHGDKGKKGKLQLTFTLQRLGEDSSMVDVEHKWDISVPGMRGKRTEDNTTNTPMCVSAKGHLSVYPLEQTDMFEAGNNVTKFKAGE